MRKKTNWNDRVILLPIVFVSLVLFYQVFYFFLYDSIFSGLDRSLTRYKRKYDKVNNVTYNYPMNKLSHDDYHTLIHKPFGFRILNPNQCNSSTFLLILVHSSPGNFAKRRLIRRTWGKKKKNRFLVLFALGTLEHPKFQKRIHRENKIYKDLIQGSFIDSYKNLTYKHVMLFKYVIYHCEQAKYVLKTDDDIFINVEAVVSFLETKVSPRGAINFLLCLPNSEKVIRSFRGDYAKWRLSYKDHPEKKHPPSCVGIFLVYSKNVIFELYLQAQNSTFFWIDDLYVTGHLFKKLKIHHVNARPYMVHQKELVKMMRRDEIEPWPFFFSGPDLNRSEMEWLDGFLNNRTEIMTNWGKS
ncbi:beta-1,3-galactosyltransferase 5-like [Coccinella septempunctata]|uniref:beta-1,3-galactosyltransferase 5-like n=1 Tax=Coccinella septempunctata TaxID=41139 RepID=UPI001D07B535|nr:beta-1,3-galactosyltransferase 5-like [Coccinella septempunctata]